jgi:uncharacterized protein (TIGR02217 family)
MPTQGFHEVRFPFSIARGARGGPERRTDIVTLGSGREERNARWAYARRKFDVGTAMKNLNDLNEVISFFEERRGRLYGFRFSDPMDNNSCPPLGTITPLDQNIGTGDGTTDTFALKSTMAAPMRHWSAPLPSPVANSVRLAVDGVEVDAADFTVDTTTGVVTFASGFIPEADETITAGFAFDMPARFDTISLRSIWQLFRPDSCQPLRLLN